MGLPFINLFSRAGLLPVDIAVAFVMFTLILGTGFVFGESATLYKDILYIYLFLFVIGRIMFTDSERKQFPIGKAIINFTAMFAVTAVIMLMVPENVTAYLGRGSYEATASMVVSFSIIYAFVKAWIEEDIFRNRISGTLKKKGVKNYEIAQAVLFGFFHFFVLYPLLGPTWLLFMQISILIVLGYIWGRMQDRFGTIGSTGSHFAYNAAIVGLLPVIMGAVV